jgi:hypothetical protein
VVVRRARALLLAALLAAASVRAAAPEYQVKAAFLYNFARFVEWPPAALEGGTAFHLCVLGEDPFGPVLADTVRGKMVHDRPVELDRPESLDEAATCHLLFVSASHAPQMPRLLAALAGRSVLTVGDTPGFAADGGMIGMDVESSKVRFDVNAQAAQRANLRISSQLLKLATRVIQ